ncbi:MAG TPA: Flp pilus assembly protein CpaB [Gaiellaceae bacterium]|nr:Flp pilus assembly protein CpaB [Gaiellaceae bacterium]
MTKYRLRNLTAAVALAVVGALLVGLYVVSYRRSVDRGAGMTQVLVAARDIPAGTAGTTVATGGYLKTAQVLRRNVVPGAIAQGADLGALIAAEPIYEGEQVTLRAFKPASEGGIFSQFSGTERAMVVPGDPNQLLAGTLATGDYVDVMANVHYRVAGNEDVAVRTILTHVLVLQAPGAQKSSTLGSASNTTSAILALTTAQAQKMLFALKNTDWWFVLRPTSAPRDSQPTIETLPDFLSSGFGPRALLQLTGGAAPGAIGQ